MKNLAILLLITCSFFSCGKDEIDYREKYVGNYNYSIYQSSYSVGRYPDPLWQYDTFAFSGSIAIVESSANRLLVHWGKDTIITYDPGFTRRDEMIVDKNGEITYTRPSYSRHFFGPASINNDTIHFRFEAMGAGSGVIWSITGVKF
jgi:hypothetical protein